MGGAIWSSSTLVLLVVMLLAVFIGYQRGLVRILFSLASTVLTLVLTAVLFQPVNAVLTEQVGLQEQISGMVQEQLEESAGKPLAQMQTAVQNAFLEQVPLPSALTTYLVQHNNQNGYLAQGAGNFAEYVSTVVSLFLVRIIAFAVTFVIVRILLYLLLSALKVAEHLPGIKSVNHMGGAVVSLAELLVFLWLFCAVAAVLPGSGVQNSICANPILGFFYRHNLLLTLFSDALGLGK